MVEISLTDSQKRIIKFWKIRGFSEIEHTFGTNIVLNNPKTKHYPCLNGIPLLYLEQMLEELK